MAPVKPIRPETQIPIEYQPVMCAVSKARAMTWVLDQLGETDHVGNNLTPAFEDTGAPEEARAWTRSVVADALRSALDDIEREYRKTKDGA